MAGAGRCGHGSGGADGHTLSCGTHPVGGHRQRGGEQRGPDGDEGDLPPGWNKHPPLPAHAHTLAASGMPGWQITLIAVGAALLAAALAVTAYRMRAARQGVTVSAA